MIIGDNRGAVIARIRELAESGSYNAKAELNDPVLSPEASRRITDAYVENRNRICFKLKKSIALAAVNTATRMINRQTKIVGLDKLTRELGGVIITSNHFNPIENTVVRHLVHAMGRRHLAVVSQTSNFAMGGAVSFLMNYADTIPLSAEPRYLARDFMSILKERLTEDGDAVLLYPEQEMWFNYRKPRPPMGGAYFYAAKLNVPIISCFVEISDTDKDDTDEFKKVHYTLHVLDVLYPSKEKTVKENTEELASIDYKLKCECYEAVYGKPLTYEFEPSDIAGWKGSL